MSDESALPEEQPEKAEAEGEKAKPTPILRFLWMLELLARILAAIFAALPAKRRKARPWQIRIGRKGRAVALSQADVNSLLQRHRDLKDIEKLAATAASFHLPESDFFADPQQMERLLRRFLEENPPWLHLNKVLAGGEQGAAQREQQILWREQVTREERDITLFIPDENWRDKPLASLTMQPARTMREVWQARLLDQVLPPEILVDRCQRGEILIPVRKGRRERLEFLAIPHRTEVEVRRRVPVPIETEGGDASGGQLLYILLDYSASMRGAGATLALAVITAVVRANLGQREARYLFRRFAEQESIWPAAVELPVQARTLEQKDGFLDTIFATNFNGGATHINHALHLAMDDIEHLRQKENLEANILLITDGRAEMLESTRRNLVTKQVKVHTVMVTPEPNPGLEALSESFTALNIAADVLPEKTADSAPVLATKPIPRRSFRI